VSEPGPLACEPAPITTLDAAGQLRAEGNGVLYADAASQGQPDARGIRGRDLVLLDVADPDRPRERSRLGPFYNGIGAVVPAVVRGRPVLYLVLQQEAVVRILDVTEPARPTDLARLPLPGLPAGLTARGPLLYATYAAPSRGVLGLAITDVANVRAPTVCGVAEPLRGTGGPAVAGARAFVSWGAGTGEGGLIVLDIADPTAPRIIGGYDMRGPGGRVPNALGQGAAVVGGLVYFLWVTAGPIGPGPERGGLIVLDMADPARPVTVGTLNLGPVAQIEVRGRQAFVSNYGGATVLDVTDPAAPRASADYTDPALGFGVRYALSAAGNRLYLSGGSSGGIRIFRCRPEAPAG
jgi:hypothetical protein